MTITAPIGVHLDPRPAVDTVGHPRQESQAGRDGRGRGLPFATESLDTVVAPYDLVHHADAEAALFEWHRVLKLGGVLALVLPEQIADDGDLHDAQITELVRLVDRIGGFVDVTTEVVAHRSVRLTATKSPAPQAAQRG